MRGPRAVFAAVAVSVMFVATLALPASALIQDPRRPVPIVLDQSQLKASCDLNAPGTVCPFWSGGGSFAVGDLNFAFLELDTWGVRKLHPCTHAGDATITDYLLHRFPDLLARHPRRPTYACSRTAAAAVYWQDLADVMNTHPTQVFPVDDCAEQVSATGDLVPCGSGTPDKYSIVGFVRLKMVAVYKGNDPLAIGAPGSPPTPGACGVRASDPNAVCLLMEVRQ